MRLAPISAVTILLCAGCAAQKPASRAPEPGHSRARTSAAPAADSAAPAPALEIAELPCPGAPAALREPARSPELAAAFAAYDQGNFQEALNGLMAADKLGGLDGEALYRLAFCLDSVRRDPAVSRNAFERSRAALQSRVDAGQATLADRFYLMNVLENLGRDDEAKAAAAQATASIESCATPVGESGDAAYRVARLYGDSGRVEKQAAWLRRAVKYYAGAGAAGGPYADRAASELVAVETGSGEWGGALLALEQMSAARPANGDLRFQLLVARMGTGDFDGALRDVETLRPLAGDRVDDLTYLEGMIKKSKRMKIAGHALPRKEPDGRIPATLTPDELNTRLLEAAQAAGPLLDQPGPESDATVVERGPQKLKVRLPSAALLERIDTAQGRLVALSMEVTRRGMPLQETAFTAGIAPLVLRDWREIWVQRRRDEWDPSVTPDAVPPA